MQGGLALAMVGGGARARCGGRCTQLVQPITNQLLLQGRQDPAGLQGYPLGRAHGIGAHGIRDRWGRQDANQGALLWADLAHQAVEELDGFGRIPGLLHQQGQFQNLAGGSRRFRLVDLVLELFAQACGRGNATQQTLQGRGQCRRR